MHDTLVTKSMKHQAIWIVSAAALLGACDPGQPDPMPAPPMDDSSGDTSGTSGMDGNSPDGSAPATASSSQTGLDAGTALGQPPADGIWVTQPNWTGFGPEASEAVFTVQCSEYGMIRLTRMLDLESAKPLRALIAAGEESEAGYWTVEDSEAMPSAHFDIYAEAPVFDAMMEADRIAVLADNKPDLTVPGSQQLNQQIVSCRNEGSGTP